MRREEASADLPKWMTKYDITPAKNIEFYLLDYPEHTARRGLSTYHRQKMQWIEEMVTSCLDCEVTKVTFGRRSHSRRVHEYFEEAFRSKSPGDAVVIYHEGTGSGKDDQYRWYFEQNPNQPIDAYSLIQQFTDSGLNVMLLLDCRIPTRFRDKWQISEGGIPGGNLEISARGEPDVTPEKQIIEGDESDFTDNLINRLETFVRTINLRRPGYRGYHAPTSIPELLRRDQTLCENPKRIFGQRASPGDVARFCIMPDHVRDTGKITFHLKTIRKVKEDDEDAGADAASSEAVPEDEGYDESMGEDVDESVAGASDGGGLFCPL